MGAPTGAGGAVREGPPQAAAMKGRTLRRKRRDLRPWVRSFMAVFFFPWALPGAVVGVGPPVGSARVDEVALPEGPEAVQGGLPSGLEGLQGVSLLDPHAEAVGAGQAVEVGFPPFPPVP